MSRGKSAKVARQLGRDVIIHQQNRGHGGNQKTCHDPALAAGPTGWSCPPGYQYDATRILDLIASIFASEKDLVLGSRFLGDPIAGGMTEWKYVSNRFLTIVESQAFGLLLSEYPRAAPQPRTVSETARTSGRRTPGAVRRGEDMHA